MLRLRTGWPVAGCCGHVWEQPGSTTEANERLVQMCSCRKAYYQGVRKLVFVSLVFMAVIGERKEFLDIDENKFSYCGNIICDSGHLYDDTQWKSDHCYCLTWE